MLDWNNPANSRVEFKEEAPKSKNVTASDKRVINGKGDINQLSHPKYPWAYEYFDNSLKNFWTPNEINMGEDIPDFTQKLTPEEQHMFVSVLGYLTTSDVLAMRNIGVAFMEKMCAPELQIFQASQIFQEAVHSITYKRCIEMLRLDEDDVYNRYRTIPEIARKIKLNNKILEPILDPHIDLSIEKNRNNFVKAYIFFSAIFEGCWFYNGFSPIFSLARRGLMKRTVEQLQYILRDEILHANFGIQVIRQIIQEENITLTRDEINDMWYEAESAELGYANYILPKPIMGYSAQDHIEQFRFIANRRARALDMPIPFEGATNALPWLDEMANMRKEKNFFEARIIEYQSGGALKWD